MARSSPVNKAAQQLATWRATSKLSQLAVAIKAGCHPNEISEYERGQQLPSRQRALKLREIAGIPVDAWDQPPETPEDAAPQSGTGSV